MKVIKIKNKEYSINHFDYFWNGAILQTVNPKNLKIGVVVAKKYYNDILFCDHSVIGCGVKSGFISRLNIIEEYKIIQMKR